MSDSDLSLSTALEPNSQQDPIESALRYHDDPAGHTLMKISIPQRHCYLYVSVDLFGATRTQDTALHYVADILSGRAAG